MIRHTFENPRELAEAASAAAADAIRGAIAARGTARVVASTGTTQYEFLDRLVRAPGIDWQRVELFHLDEYVGISPEHPASMQRYIRDRIVAPTGITRAFLLDGTRDPRQMCSDAAAAISSAPVDITFAGVGENGHLAFNDPPADFETSEPFLIVNLDQRGRQQQVDEGWFRSLDEVPRQAVTMSVPQILKSRAILCIATGARKAEAVQRCFEGPISPMAPASALRLHPAAELYLDRAAVG